MDDANTQLETGHGTVRDYVSGSDLTVQSADYTKSFTVSSTSVDFCRPLEPIVMFLVILGRNSSLSALMLCAERERYSIHLLRTDNTRLSVLHLGCLL